MKTKLQIYIVVEFVEIVLEAQDTLTLIAVKITCNVLSRKERVHCFNALRSWHTYSKQTLNQITRRENINHEMHTNVSTKFNQFVNAYIRWDINMIERQKIQ